jgi:PAS domain S-box-containing protein
MPSPWKASPLWQRLLVALLIVAVGSAIRAIFFGGLGRGIPYLLYFPAVTLAALYGGLAAGLLATISSAALAFFWIQRGFLSPVETMAMAVFITSGAMISLVCEAMHRAQARVEWVREQAEQAEARLRETNEYLDSLFNYANAPIIVWDPQFKVTRFNRAFESLTGRSANEVIGNTLELLFPPAFVESSMALIKKTTGGERWETVEIPILRQDGATRTLLWNSATVFAPDGKKPMATIAQGQDITARKETEAQLQRTLADLDRSNKELEQFAYVASHDLQEPLRMVGSYTQLLAQRYQGQLDDKAQKYIRYAVDGALRMQTLVNDLLAYSRVGTRSKPPGPTDVQAVLNEATQNLAAAIAEARAIITNDDLPTVRADPSQLVLVFQNLLANAIKFHGEDLPRIHVSARDQGDAWLFSVRDNGIGIEPQHAERVFVIFQRLHTRAEYPGTGIGLAVCRRIVERHGGKIWFESELGKGTTFFFTVPK